MICSKCGAALPEGSKFCFKCGTNLTVASGKQSGVQECSEKNQLMVRVPGRGLYFIANDERLCFYDETARKAQALSKWNSTVHMCGLGYSGGKLYYWQECQDRRSEEYGMRLLERDVDSGETRVVWQTEEEMFNTYRLDEGPQMARAILYQGSYYLLDHVDQSLMQVELPSGEQDNLELPDLSKKLPLFDWIKPRGMVDIKSTEDNFGVDYTGLDLLDGKIYLSLDGSELCTMRFPLGKPEEVNYLPANSCTSVQNSLTGGMLTSVGGRVFSCPGYSHGGADICVYEIKPDGNLIKMISGVSAGVSLMNKGGLWWKLDNTVYIGAVALNLYERKWHRLSPLLFDKKEHKDNVFGEVKDFFPARGGVYLLTDTTLYLVPSDWESRAKSVSDLAQFELARLKKL